MSNRELQDRKALLLNQVQQQRLDLSAGKRDWFIATESYDRGWITLLSLRGYLLIGSSLITIYTVRHPNFLIRWAKRGLGIWSAWRLARKMAF